MPSRSVVRPPAAPGFAAWTAQRVEAYLAFSLPSPPAGGPLTIGSSPRLPGAVVGHGEHPRDAAWRAALELGLSGVLPAPAGLRLACVLSDVRPRSGRPALHVLRLVLRPRYGRPGDGTPVDPALLHTPTKAPDPEAVAGDPPRVQRAAAYALVVRGEEVLLTRLAGSGRWTLPGGGIDHGEHPDEAVRRETNEETGLELATAELLDVDSLRFTGRSPRAVTEDYHGVRLLYRGTVSASTAGRQPEVQETGGTTDAAAWWPLDRIDRLRLSTVVRPALALGC